jgi:small subunit ribosomal protein S17
MTTKNTKTAAPKAEKAAKPAKATKTATPAAAKTAEKKFKKKLQGVVVSDKTNKTIVVKVERRYMHHTYSKFLQTTKKYHVHDENNAAKEGNVVTIIESKPHSKLKKWELLKIH